MDSVSISIQFPGIEDDDVICSTPVSSASTGVIHQSAPQSIPVQKTPPPQPASKTLPSQQSSQQQHQQLTAKHFNPSQLLAQLQSPAQVCNFVKWDSGVHGDCKVFGGILVQSPEFLLGLHWGTHVLRDVVIMKIWYLKFDTCGGNSHKISVGDNARLSVRSGAALDFL